MLNHATAVVKFCMPSSLGQIPFLLAMLRGTKRLEYINHRRVHRLSHRIQMASKVTTSTTRINRDLVRTGKFDLKDMEWIANWTVSVTHVLAD
jgi:hypothetical protein